MRKVPVATPMARKKPLHASAGGGGGSAGHASAARQSSILRFFGPAPSAATTSRVTPPSRGTPATSPALRLQGSITGARRVRDVDEEGDGGPPAKRALFVTEVEEEDACAGRKGPIPADGLTGGLADVTQHEAEDEDRARAVRRRRIVTVDEDDDNDGDSGGDDEPLLATHQGRQQQREVLMDNKKTGLRAGAAPTQSPTLNQHISTPAKRLETTDSEDKLPLSTFARGEPPRAGVPSQRKRLAFIDLSGAHVEEDGGWCDKNPWSVRVLDSQKRTPDHPDYDPTTLHIPASVLAKMSPFQKQFWELKRQYYNTMLFVKKGAFMEAYDIDADIVHKELGLNYTGGGRAAMRCAGVPESALNRHAARLIDLGYRVGIVAQTETANAAEMRKASASSSSDATSKICQRSLVRILTRATVTEEELLRDHRARYVLALIEADEVGANSVGEIVIGACFVDAASGRITVGEYLDDRRRSWTEKLISTLRPPEILVPLNTSISARMRSLLRWTSSGSTPVEIIHKGEAVFTPMTQTWLRKYILDENSSPVLRLLTPEYLQDHRLAARSLGAVANYLSALLVDKEILSLGNYTVLPPIRPEDSELYAAQKEETKRGNAGSGTGCEIDPATAGTCVGDLDNSINFATTGTTGLGNGYDPCRALGGGLNMDAATLANLEVMANVMDGSERFTLVSIIDRAGTPAGRRLLRRWIVDPLSLSAAINDRLNAVEAIHAIDSGTLSLIRRLLMSGPDLERSLPRLHQYAVVADVAVMFDDTNARRVKDFVKVLRGLETTIEALERLRNALPARCNAQRLSWLTTPGCGIHSDASTELQFFLGSAFDVKVAEKDGEIVPNVGGSPHFDAAKAKLEAVEEQLNVELERWQEELRDRSISYYHRGKETYQLEVKVETVNRAGIPRSFTPSSEAKGVKRFYTSRVRDLMKLHVGASEAFADASMNVFRDVVSRFDEKRDIWTCVVKASAEIDALIGLAVASFGDGSGPMVRPVVLPDDHPCAVFEAVQLRHPVLAAKAGSAFVSNDTTLGGKHETIALVTGSNCSGKSTLSRQIAVAVILAQTGVFVPARSLKIRPFNAIYARAGSRDEICRGRSTFMVEMEEAAQIVNTATDRSLVIVDELSSGTTAQDAHAISHATLERLLSISCLTVFCTHADALATEFAGRVGNYTMAADVDEVEKTIVFLYKLVRGVTNHSRGVFCARVAGIPSCIADEAEGVAERFDESLLSNRMSSSFVSMIRALEKNDDSALSVMAGLSSLRALENAADSR